MPTYLLPNAAPIGGFATTFPHFDNNSPYTTIYIAMIFDNTWSFMITGRSDTLETYWKQSEEHTIYTY